MKFFKRRRTQATSSFEEDSLDAQFDSIMTWVRDLARKDYNKLKKAMDKDYDAYQILHGIEPVEEDRGSEPEYQLLNEEVEK